MQNPVWRYTVRIAQRSAVNIRCRLGALATRRPLPVVDAEVMRRDGIHWHVSSGSSGGGFSSRRDKHKKKGGTSTRQHNHHQTSPSTTSCFLSLRRNQYPSTTADVLKQNRGSFVCPAPFFLPLFVLFVRSTPRYKTLSRTPQRRVVQRNNL